MLQPARTKFRKQQKGHMRGRAKGGDHVSFGDFGLQALQPGYLTARQIESARVAITRAVKKAGKLYIRIFPDKPITKKPAETRMGKGKGGNEGYVCVVRPGRVLFELEGVDRELAQKAFTNAHHKLPIDTQLIAREPVV
jgi:large subunit ribosomal protein L16